MNDSKKKLIVLTGPTAVGKTAISIELAKRLGGEIISADSMQVYRDMNIGTDKISKEKMNGVPHYLIDICDAHDDFNVCMFQKYAKQAMEQIYAKGHIPIIVGGTGFYIQSVLYDIDFSKTDDEDTSYRDELEKRAAAGQTHELYTELMQVDPESCMAIHENNVKRVIRALEFYHQTGRKISEDNQQQRQKTSPYDFRYFVLTNDRKVLYDRIEKRIDQMIDEGLEDEVANLINAGVPRTATSMQGLGYHEMYDHLLGEYDLDRAIYLIKRNTRHFAKRQLTWFNREKEIRWIDKQIFDSDAKCIDEIIKQCDF